MGSNMTDILNAMFIVLAAFVIFVLIYRHFSHSNKEAGEIQDALLGPEELERHAVEIARNHIVADDTRSISWLVPRMNDNYKLIAAVYNKLNEYAKNKKPTASAAEWLLDNFYIIEQQVKEIRQSLSKKYCSQLPVLKSGPLRGYPRVYAIALELVAHTDGRFNEKSLVSFIKAYQSQSLLSSGELWAMAIMVRIALIENIRRICEKIINSQQQFLKADETADLLLSRLEQPPEVLVQLMKENIKGMEKLTPSYTEHLLQRLKKQQHKAAPILQYLDERLVEQDNTAEKIIQQEHQEQAARQISIGNSITSLRLVSALDWSGIFECLSQVEQILRQDPAGIYPRMDFASRDYYRHEIERISRAAKINETQIARKAIECAQAVSKDNTDDERLGHVGYYLIGKGRAVLNDKIGYKPKGMQKIVQAAKNHPTFLYLSSIILITAVIAGVFISYAYRFTGRNNIWLSLLAGIVVLIPASDIAVAIVNWVSTRISRPVILPKLELENGIPENETSMVVIPTLLPNEERVRQLVSQLEVFYLANREKNLFFALVGDYKDAPQEEMPEETKIIQTAILGIKELNERYASKEQDIFYFFHRYRQYNAVQNKWMGWERKRGALIELNDLLQGSKETSFSVISGDLSKIPQIKYVITLDADTSLPKDAAKKLIGTMAHPLNRPILDEKLGIVVEGYGLLQPRINVDIVSANRSFFSRVFAGQGGVDPYTTAVSDVYQDLFGEGIFTGKGIYDVDIFQKALKNAIPENTVLSHDLLEGSYVRAGLVTDIDFIDGYPARYSAYAARLHRWVRGDWQLIPWLASRVKDRQGKLVRNSLSTIAKWKIFDNMRRSLTAPALTILIALSFGVLPGNSLVWLSFAVLTLFFSLVTATVDAVLAKNYRFCGEKRHCTIIYGFKATLYQVLLLFVFLPYQAYLMGDAIIRTLIRVFVTKRNTLEWVTAADAEKRLKNDIKSFWKRMWVSGLIGGIILGVAILLSSPVWLVALLFFVVWSAAPFIAYFVSIVDEKNVEELSDEDRQELRRLARKNWRYFEDFVGAQEHYLPPDNYQEDPPNGIAHRTSPTNIGFALISVLAARDLGYMGILEMGERLNNTLKTVEKLEKWKGHLYNWYDTRTLEILRPRYISTVDSGNFIGYLMTLKQGLKEYMGKPLADMNLVLGLRDTIHLLKEEDNGVPLDTQLLEEAVRDRDISLVKWNSLLQHLLQSDNKLNSAGEQSKYKWLTKVYHMLSSFEKDIKELMPWVRLIDTMPEAIQEEKNVYAKASREIKDIFDRLQQSSSLAGLNEVCRQSIPRIDAAIGFIEGVKKKNSQHDATLAWAREVKNELERSSINILKALDVFNDLINRIQTIIDGTSFVPLFDSKRQLFSIGYNVEEEQLTKSYYDLFASEARQTSFIAIARGEVDLKHWYRLGRNLTMVDGYKGLVSWTGTMFEYLMPLLIMRNYKNTLWDETYRFVVESQRKYGRQRQVPWGTSESGYYAFDINLNYQYKAFGVPELGLKRGLSNDMVVAPYATVMALMVDPVNAAANMKQLKEEGAEGLYGFYESIDYTPERLSHNQKNSIVKSFMVHHQGMSLMALVNYLNHNIMQNRFHAEPMVKSAELLLQERVPTRVILTKEHKEKIEPFKPIEQEHEEVVRILGIPGSPLPHAHILSNGSYSVMLTDSGSGYSRNQGNAVTRWREDLSFGNFGMFFYIQNLNSNNVWSATYAPYYDQPEEYKVVFSADKAEFLRRDGNIDTHTEIVVSPEDNAEIRRISLTNHSEHTRTLEVTSYFEVVLTSQSADVAHPAFSNLFVRTEFLPEYNCLLANRRPREEGKNTIWAVHTVMVEGEAVGGIQYETDRTKFIGRGRNLSNPLAMDVDQPLSNTVGPVLDPVMSLRCRVKIGPGQTARIAYITGVSDNYGEIIKLTQKYQEAAAVARAFELAWTRSQVETRYLGLKSGEEEVFQNMLSQILFASPLRRRRESIIQNNKKGQPALWAYGISGDVPIVLVIIGKTDEMDIVHQILKAHEYWRMKGLSVDLVILNEDEGSYTQPLQNLLRDIVSVSHARELQDKPGGVFIRSGRTMPEEDKILLLTVARIVLRGDDGPLSSQVKLETDKLALPGIKEWKKEPKIYEMPKVEIKELSYYNGWGGFSADGKEYIIQLKEDQRTPAPWMNVISNQRFGFQVTESGGGYTWSENSRENKLTPWSNDPVSDPNGEVFYLRDEDTGELWSITPLPIREAEPYIIRHGHGYSIFEHTSHGIKQELIEFVPRQEPVKICMIKLKNMSQNPRSLSATYYIRPVLGVSDQLTAQYIATRVHDDTGILLIENSYNSDFPGRIAFMDVSEKERSFTGDRTEFFGHNGDMSNPEALKRERLSNRTGAGYDPCASMQARVDLDAGEEKKIVFLLGQSKDVDEIISICKKYRSIHEAEKELQSVKAFWEDTLGAVKVKTPDLSMDLILNGWLLYQTISCRIWARSAFYQSGGAYGFRDQLQDVMAVVYVLPELTHSQILRHAAHQFVEGDVQHWWHPAAEKESGADKGIRTKFSDDLVWLPFVTADYIENTGDWNVLQIEIPYIEDELLREGEDERYNIPRLSQEKSSVYEHCVRAIDRALRFGQHGIPLMGSGDWNDGMSTVGNKGRGESVWLGWFLYTTLARFIPICEYQQDFERAERYKSISQEIVKSLEANAWDGGWYRRAYFDDGTPMGSAQNPECKIDSLAQSWSVISGAAKPHRSKEAMGALEHYLIKRDEGLIMLLTPPFDKGELKPGYIKGYVPGVRENGGQYTHAAIWVILAFAKMGDGDKAWEMFNLINPVNHARTPIEAARYKVEPYVMAADVYAVPPHVGRGGWTWYTGAAGWMYRVGVEHILGLKKRGETLIIDPCIPKDWDSYRMEYRYKDTKYVIHVMNPDRVNRGVKMIKLDGKESENRAVPLLDDRKEHYVEVTMGKKII
jgi:cellobiose phosphorylase